MKVVMVVRPIRRPLVDGSLKRVRIELTSELCKQLLGGVKWEGKADALRGFLDLKLSPRPWRSLGDDEKMRTIYTVENPMVLYRWTRSRL